MIDLQIDEHELNRLAMNVGALEGDADKALKSTIMKMAKWLKTRSLRGLSAELQMKQKIIRRRLKAMRVRNTPNGAQAKVWFGLNPVGVIWLDPRQNAAGVSANGKQYDHAWIAKNGKQVFKRVGRSRLPIEVVEQDIKDEADRFLERGIVESYAFADQFYKTFEHELSWRMQQRR